MIGVPNPLADPFSAFRHQSAIETPLHLIYLRRALWNEMELPVRYQMSVSDRPGKTQARRTAGVKESMRLDLAGLRQMQP